MKGYITNNIEYIFEVEAAEIPYVGDGVTGIAIQPECLDAFKEANPSYADLMFGYNFQTITAQPKPFAGHTDDDLTPPTPVDTYSLTLEGEFKDNCSYTYVDGWTPIEDFEHVPAEAGIRIAILDEQYTFDKNDTSGKTILVPTLNGVDLTDEYSSTYVDFSMPNSNSVISIEANLPSPELSWSGDATVYIDDSTHDYPTLSNPHSVTVEYTTQSPETISIDSSTGEITLITTGDAVVGAIFNGDENYRAQEAWYLLHIEPGTTPAPIPTYELTVDDQTSNSVIQIRPRSVDPSAVEEGTEVKAIISNSGQGLGYTFDITAQAPAIPIIATLDGVQLTKNVDEESVSFLMPGSNATLVITEYTPL